MKFKINLKTQAKLKIFLNQFFRKKGEQLKQHVDTLQNFLKNIILCNKLFLGLMNIFN